MAKKFPQPGSGVCVNVQEGLKELYTNPFNTPVGFLGAISCFADGTPWPKCPHPYPERKKGRPSKAVLAQRKLIDDWFYENITKRLDKERQKSKNKKIKITYNARG